MLNEFLNKRLLIKGHDGNELWIKGEFRKDKKLLTVEIEGKEVMIAFDDLWTTLFPMANDDQQDKMIPTKTTRTRILEQLLTIRLNKDCRKGELVAFKHKVSVPEEMICVKPEGDTKILIPKK